MKIYVGNLIATVTVQEIRDLFAHYGLVRSVDIWRKPGQIHAHAFVEMETEDALEAIHSLDRQEFMGYTLRVEEAKPAHREVPVLKTYLFQKEEPNVTHRISRI